jgi:Restriction endonuclease
VTGGHGGRCPPYASRVGTAHRLLLAHAPIDAPRRVAQARLCERRPTELAGSDCGAGGSSLEDSLGLPYDRLPHFSSVPIAEYMAIDKSGRSLEQAVAAIQQLFDPQSTVTTNEFIVDRLGNSREFDVVVRGNYAGQPMLCVIECKNWSDKVGTPVVDAFLTKARNVNANIILIVSKRGFTDPALRQAKHEGIGALSLLPDDPIDAGFCLGTCWYAKHYYWYDSIFIIRHDANTPLPEAWKHSEVLLPNGKSILAWFENQLCNMQDHLKEETVVGYHAVFKQPTELTVSGSKCIVHNIIMTATRKCLKKRKRLRVTGDAFYNWDTGLVQVPGRAELRTEVFTLDYDDWEEYDGNIDELLKTPARGFPDACFVSCARQFIQNEIAADISECCTIEKIDNVILQNDAEQ